MTDKFREKTGYLSDEMEENVHLSSSSPHFFETKTENRSPRRASRSPRSPRNNTTKSHDSRPEIAAWPAPPPATATAMKPVAKTNPVRPSTSTATSNMSDETNNLSEDSAKLFTMLKVAAASTANRGRESELRRRIQNLEETVAEYEKQKYNVMGTFTEYRERVVERERKLEAEYSSKIIALSEEVLSAKKDFEARMKSFQALQEKFEREKEQALEKMRKEHQKEIQVLEQRFSASQLLNLEQKYIIEIRRLEEERKSLRAEKERLGETFEMKLRRAQSLYETELTAAKMLYTKELEALRDHEEALKEELAARQDEFHDRLQELELQAQHSKDEMNICRQDVAMLEKKLKAKEEEVQTISRDLTTATKETQKALDKLETITNDCDRWKADYKEQQQELQSKIQMLSAAENTKSKLENIIKELQTEVRTLKNKVEFLEKERENLQSQSESQTQLQNSQVKALEAVLESLTKEKESTKEHYEKMLEKEREQAEEREFSMKKEFSTKLNELEEQYGSLREHLETSETFGPENVKLWEEIEMLRSEKANLEDEVNGLKTQLRNETRSEETEKLSLEYVIELLKAIESIKSRLSKGGSRKSSVSSKSKENSADFERRIMEVDIRALKNQFRDELACKNDHKGFEVNSILNRLYELESSLMEIIEEKEDAIAAVEKLSVENQEMHAKIEALERGQMSEFEKNDEIDKLKTTVEEQQQTIISQQELLADHKVQMEQLQSKLEERNKTNKDFEESETLSKEEISRLTEELDRLNEEKSKVDSELKSKKNELTKISKKTEDYVRQRDQKQNSIYEKKIEQIREEHVKDIQKYTEKQTELEEKIEKLESELADLKKIEENKNEVMEDSAQTDFNDTSAEEIKSLKQLVKDLQMEIKNKDEKVSELEKLINDEEKEFDTDIVEKNERSHSIATTNSVSSSHACHKNVFQTFVSQMTDKKEKKEAKALATEAKKAEKRKEKEEEKKLKELKKSNAALTRAKSPSLLTRLRDRSPSKSKFTSPEPAPSNGSKNLLSPTDAEKSFDDRSDKTRRKTKEGSVPNDKSEKRPAWKF
uniref:Protein FAM184A/B N-terminal domain-containing protein n=1 Tax=Panagrolaimus sp. JU765 TaxID=591449 RepID=A0AC34Q5A6_9BILA